MFASVSAITVDCHDPSRLAAFWGALLDIPEAPSLPGWRRLGSPGDRALRINLQPVPESKTGKNRLHRNEFCLVQYVRGHQSVRPS